MRIIFMGTPDFAVAALDALVEAKDPERHEVIAAYTQPPRPGGRRGRELTPTPVHARAAALGIEVRHPVSLRGADVQAAFAALGADVAVVAAYGLILPHAVLDAPRLGCLNIHASLLPRWRGAAPIQRAILAGDAETGVTIMRMEAGLDTGPMLAFWKTPIADKTNGDLTKELAHRGGWLIAHVLEDLPSYRDRPQPAEGITYAHKIDKPEARLNFVASAEQVLRQIHAFSPTPGAWFEYQGERIKILAAEHADLMGAAGKVMDDQLTIACRLRKGDRGAIRPTLVQRAGKPAMPTADLLRGFPIPAGTRLE